MKLTEALSQIFFPSDIKCIVCGNEIFSSHEFLCEACKFSANDNFCIACGRGIPDMSDFCDQCKQRPFDFTSARAPFLHKDGLRRVLHRLKYGGAKYVAEIFGQLLAQSFLTYDWKIDVVTFVPMHKKRLRQRGYNQARLIAEAFCKQTDLSLLECFSRIKYTPNFARMTRGQREAAIKGTITIKSEPTATSVLIIDDVFTTGTTANECARLLKSKGASAVYILTVATSSIKPILY